MTELPRRISAAEIDNFTITADLANGRVWLVEGEAIARFAAMTNWDYYEATLRFQKVLDSAGEAPLDQHLKPAENRTEVQDALGTVVSACEAPDQGGHPDSPIHQRNLSCTCVLYT